MSSDFAVPAHGLRRVLSVLLTVALAAVPAVVMVPAAQAVQGELSFVAEASTVGNRSNHRVTVPAGVQAGDALVMVLTTNSTSSTVNNTVAGWTLLEAVNGTGTRGRVWTRTATGSDAGSVVTVTTSAAAKSVMSLAAYRSDVGDPIITASAGRVVNTSATSHATPAVPVDEDGSWLLSYWAEKSTGTKTWTTPAGTTQRHNRTGSGSGKVSAVLADSDGAVATGQAPARTATTSPATSRTVMFSVVVDPGGEPDPVNQAPTAAFTSSCTDLTCSFDASGSTDPENGTLTYAWDFGDGETGTGVSPSHTYADAGTRTVTLTVSDGELTDEATGQVEPTEPVVPPAQGELSYVGSASTSGNRSTHSVQVPAAVRAGDVLVLFLTTNSTSSTVTESLAGWTQVESEDGSGTRGRVWTRRANSSSAGSTVSVTGSAFTKSVLAVAAYRSNGTPQVTAATGSNSSVSQTQHTGPDAPVAEDGSWLVSWFSEKSSTDLSWTGPAGTSTRAADTASGAGKVSALLTDAPVPAGTAAGQTASTDLATARNVLFSVVVTPGAATDPDLPPTAAFTASCPGDTCSFDAGGSTDPENGPLTYAWDFGNGTTGTGVSPSRTYSDTGAYTVTLTVDDGLHSVQATQVVTPTVRRAGPGHTGLVPQSPRLDTPRITEGEIWDIEVVGDRVFIAGDFGSLRNSPQTNNQLVDQALIASYNINTGLIDTGFRPVITGGGVNAIEASPDGQRLYIAGSFNNVNGVTRRNIARIDIDTGATVTGFSAQANARGVSLAVTNSTVYVGGRFTEVNGTPRVALVALDGQTGQVRQNFVNNLSGGIGVNGALAVQQLKLTRDERKLLVVHTGRQVNGQDRYGVAMISTLTHELLPWKTMLWQDNLPFVGGIQRAYGADISPDDSYFVVGSGSGGDRPPINDTVMAFPVDGGGNVQPMWIARHFDSIYGLAVSETAVYVGGHFAWAESPESPQPWPGLDDQGYGTGQGLSGYGLGDSVVSREHVAALNPTDGTALEWNPGSNSFEGDKAMEVTERGLFSGGDATTQGGHNIGRVAFYDFASVPVPNGAETTITTPYEGRVEGLNEEVTVAGTATAVNGVQRVQVEVFDRQSQQYLQDDLTSWGAWNGIDANLTSPGATSTDWSLGLTFTQNRRMRVEARTFQLSGPSDNTKASKKFETFGLADQPPNTNVTGPSSPVGTTTFTVLGNATDDFGVDWVTITFRDTNLNYLQADGTASPTYHSFRFRPDLIGATNATWSYEVALPHEGQWRAQARAIDTAGQIDLDTGDRTWIVTTTGTTPTVSISQPVTMIPPTTAQNVVVPPGGRMTFAGSANDDAGLSHVELTIRNNTTREYLAADGTWSPNNSQGWHRVSPINNLPGTSYNWSWTTPFDLSPGNYTFNVRAWDDTGMSTPSAQQGRLTIIAQVPGDNPPDGLISPSGTFTGWPSLQLNLAGTATDDRGVAEVRVSLRDADTARYVQPDGSAGAGFATLQATLASPGATSTSWSLPVTLPAEGDWNVTVFAVDTAGQQDTNTAGATARYLAYPSDLPPTITEALLAPTEGSVYTDGRIQVSGRAEDDQSMKRVEVAVIDSAGRYLGSNGLFTSTTASWRTAFLTSPGTPGSNFSYSTPIIPEGAYRIQVRALDHHDQYTPVPSERNVTVTHPPGNVAPVAAFTVSCQENRCTLDGRSSTDENVAQMTYSWSFGTNQGTATGPVPIKTFTAAATHQVTLTVRDEWGLTHSVTQPVTITEPAGNVAPNASFGPPSCAGLSCNFSALSTTDPNPGDTITYRWEFGYGTATSTASAPSHTFPAPGTYTVRLTATDGWGKASSVTRDVTVTSP